MYKCTLCSLEAWKMNCFLRVQSVNNIEGEIMMRCSNILHIMLCLCLWHCEEGVGGLGKVSDRRPRRWTDGRDRSQHVLLVVHSYTSLFAFSLVIHSYKNLFFFSTLPLLQKVTCGARCTLQKCLFTFLLVAPS